MNFQKGQLISVRTYPTLLTSHNLINLGKINTDTKLPDTGLLDDDFVNTLKNYFLS